MKNFKQVKSLKLKTTHKERRVAWSQNFLASIQRPLVGKRRRLDPTMVVWSDEKLLRMQATNMSTQNKSFWTHLTSKKEALAANPNLGVIEQSKGISRGVM
eukprot:527667-Amphidinium_carterae.1